MSNFISLDNRYSTTKMLTAETPKELNNILHLPELKKQIAEGGLRTKGYFKQTYNDKPLISIVTVVYNGEDDLERTIQSVLNQTYENIEYIVIDGASTDNTLGIIKRYEDKIDYWVSEPDKGIYDAMNKGITLATGDWINLMNSGDTFYQNNVIETIFNKTSFENIDVVYGDHNIIYPNKTRIVKAGNIKDFWKGSQFCHQSTFVSKNIYIENKYNLDNKIVSDFEFFYKLSKQHKNFAYVHTTVANYSSGGLSDINRIESILERWSVIDKSLVTNLYYTSIILQEIIKNYIKRIVQ